MKIPVQVKKVAHYPLSGFVKSIYQGLADTLLPSRCLLCGAAAGAHSLCAACEGDLPRLPEAACPRCLRPTVGGCVCGACLKSPPAFDSLFALFAYAFPADRLILALKYRAQFGLADWLAQRLGEALAGQLRQTDALVALPLHSKRLAERGFNQTHEIGKRLAAKSGLALLPQALRKIRATPNQSRLPVKQRQANLKGAFAASADVAGLRLLLLDDVTTTGATLHEAARTLKAAGALRVDAAVAARTLRD
ncbi:MAG: ComF family protein [Zoogloeaceae bacterium]|jgi:ComF family protein|nr:ComF family protein [Zoogloeaceae bacterium]